MTRILLAILLCVGISSAMAQNTITISESGIQDAMIYNNTRPGYEYTRAANYGSNIRNSAVAWTASGYKTYMRSLISFNVSGLAPGTVVQSATLFFYSDPTVSGSSDANGNSQLSGSNAFYLEKVTSSWSESSVTWNNQPTTTATGRVWTGPSTSTTENIQINLTAMVQEWVNNPSANYGVRMILENELNFRSRNYATKNHSNTSIRPRLVVTYQPNDNNTVFQDDMNTIFQVDRSYVTTGLLKDYGMRLGDVNKYSGVVQADNPVTRSVFQSLYGSLHYMKFNGNATLPSPAAVNTAIQNYSATVNELKVNNIIALHYKYEQFRSDALSSNLVYVSNNKIYDTPGRSSSPYETKTIFAATPVEEFLYGNNHIFRFRSELFFTNVSKPISGISIDFDDGAGYRSVSFGTSDINISYSTDGPRNIRTRITYSDGEVVESRSTARVAGTTRACSSCRYGTADLVVDFPRSAFPVPIGSMGTARATIYYGGVDAVLDRPIIIAEGFDPFNAIGPRSLFDPTALLVEIAPGLTLEEAIDDNFDLIFVNNGQGGDQIQRNAFVLENVIQWVNEQKALVGSPHLNVVIGVSMGCLVAKYALRDMEMRGVNHGTRLYVSFDGPHLGANVPLAFQAAVRYMAALRIFGTTFIDLAPQLQEALDALNSNAARQMLQYQLAGTGANLTFNTSDFTTFMNEYRSQGMPSGWGIRNIAVANGSECGTSQGFAPYSQMLSANAGVDMFYTINLMVGFLQSYFNYTNPVPMLESLFSTDADLKFDLDLRALPDQQAQRIFYFRLYYRKEILWGAITSTKDIFNFSYNSTAAMLPLDSSPGGWFNINEFGAIPANLGPIGLTPVQTRFSFIPTTSALNIGGGNQPIVNSDLARAYSPTAPPSAPKNVPFHNFFTNPQANEHHIQFTPQNANWLWQEIQGTPAFFSCSYVCGGTEVSPSISGSSSVCGNQTYTLLNATPGAALTWSNSSNLTYVSGQSSPNYTVSGNSSGAGQVLVVLTGACGTSGTFTKSVNVGGGYSSGDYPVSGPSSVCTGQPAYYNTVQLPLATSYNWFWPSSWQYGGGQGTRYLDLYVPSGASSGAVGVRVATACDPGGSPATKFTNVSNCGGFMMSIYPNPASSELNVEPIGDDETASPEYEVKLYDGSGNLRKKAKSANGKVKVDVRDLKKGVYQLHLITKDETVSSQILIER